MKLAQHTLVLLYRNPDCRGGHAEALPFTRVGRVLDAPFTDASSGTVYRMNIFYICMVVVFLSLAAQAKENTLPVRIHSGEKSQTKTYMHQFVDSPDGTKYAFRYFPGDNQPRGARGEDAGGSPCEIWICNSDLAEHYKAFASPKSESGHGSDVIAWVTDNLIYYAGILYQLSTNKVLWQFTGSDATIPLARMHPVNANKLYVGIRGSFDPRGPEHSEGSESLEKGWYWLDPSSPTKPRLHLVNDLRILVGHYGGSWENAEATYIHQNPSDTKLHVVVYDRTKRLEFAFVLNAKDGSVHSFLGPNRRGGCSNGHVLWYDDETLMAGNQHPGLFDLEGNLIERLAGPREGDHISISPDRKWWIADTYTEHDVRLYRFGSPDSVIISGDVKFSDHHPSFSRDGRYVFFQGERPSEPQMGVYRVDVSTIIGLKNKASGNTESGCGVH